MASVTDSFDQSQENEKYSCFLDRQYNVEVQNDQIKKVDIIENFSQINKEQQKNNYVINNIKLSTANYISNCE